MCDHSDDPTRNADRIHPARVHRDDRHRRRGRGHGVPGRHGRGGTRAPALPDGAELVRVTLNINGQTPPAARRAALVAALRAARAAGPDRHQARLRARRVRRLHGARGRQAGLLLHDAGRRVRGQGDHHARRADEGRGTGHRAAGVRRGGRLPVRLLHARADHGGRRAAAGEPEPDDRRDPDGRQRQPLPVRRLRPHLQGGRTGRPS